MTVILARANPNSIFAPWNKPVFPHPHVIIAIAIKATLTIYRVTKSLGW